MIMTYFYLVIAIPQVRTCNPDNKTVPLVPEHLRPQVIAKLAEYGYDFDGKKIVV